MATVADIRVHPIKSLEPAERARTRFTEAGGLETDRAYAIRDRTGDLVNGKRTAAVHRIRADYDLDEPAVTLGHLARSGRESFHLDDDREALCEWLSSAVGFTVDLEAAPGGDLTDSRLLGGGVAGATLVSTATLETVASWFPDVDVEGVRRRFRPNLEVGGVEPFWEDRLVGEGPPRLRVGDVAVRGVKPIARCVVPTRDPGTGEPTPGFRERFVERRRETFPSWGDTTAFDHWYALTALVHPEPGHAGDAVAVGDPVELLG